MTYLLDTNDLVFVCHDKKACWLGLHELHARGERLIGLHVFLRRLHEDAGLTREIAGEVSAASGSEGVKPTWWDAWLSTSDGSAQPALAT